MKINQLDTNKQIYNMDIEWCTDKPSIYFLFLFLFEVYILWIKNTKKIDTVKVEMFVWSKFFVN
jgi:hypothetical protein